MGRPVTDYRSILGSKPNFHSVRQVKLRTRRRHGDLEILRDPRDGIWKRFRHGVGFEPCDRDGAEGGGANAAPVPQDRHARAEGIAQPNPMTSKDSPHAPS